MFVMPATAISTVLVASQPQNQRRRCGLRFPFQLPKP